MSDVVVQDAAGVIRVLLGNIGNAQSPDYGLRLIGPAGAVTIIDGTSDMFKILATGTLSGVWAAANNTAVSAAVTIIGSGGTVLSCTWLITPSTIAGTFRTSMTYVAPNATGNVLAIFAATSDINAGDNRLTLTGTNYAGSPFNGQTFEGRYYLLQEVGI